MLEAINLYRGELSPLTLDSGLNKAAEEAAKIILLNKPINDVNLNNTILPSTNTKIDKDGDGFLSKGERNEVTMINVEGGYKGQKIANLKGIEYFSRLATLNCAQNNLRSLNVSQNTQLEILDCYQNKLPSLDLSRNHYVYNLNAKNNYLTSLNVENTNIDIINDIYSRFDAQNNTYPISVGSDRTFDLSTLPGKFEVSKASGWVGGTVPPMAPPPPIRPSMPIGSWWGKTKPQK